MKIHCKYDALIDIKSLTPFKQNRNNHTDDQIERLARLLQYQGIRAPIVVDARDNTTIAKGHGTLLAIKKNGWESAPVVYQQFESDEQFYAYVQSDNAIQSWAELDLSGINADIGDLGPDFPVDLLGIKDFVIEPAELPYSKPNGDPKDREAVMIICPNCGCRIDG
jgi:hypothetical protein